MVDKYGIRLDPTKVQDLAQWYATTSALQVKSFMGGIIFYRKIIPHFSQLARPLHHVAN